MPASIADTLIQGAQQQNQAQPLNITGGIAAGAQLAHAAEQNQIAQADLKVKQDQLQMAKYEKVANLYEIANKMEDGKQKDLFTGTVIPKIISGIGLGDQIDVTAQKSLAANPGLIPYLREEVRSGRITMQDGLKAAVDPVTGAALQGKVKQFTDAQGVAPSPQMLTQIFQDELGSFRKASELNIEDQRKIQAAQLQAEASAGRAAPFEERNINQTHENALNRVTDKNKIMGGLLTSSQNLQNALTNFEKGGSTPQEYAELQQAVRSNAGIKTAGGVSERAETFAKSAGIDAQALYQFAFADPQSIKVSSPELAKLIVKLGNLEIQNKSKQAHQLSDANAKAYASFYKQHPDKAVDFEAARKATLDQFDNFGPKTYNIFGQSMDEDKARDFIKQNPQFAPQLDATTKKDLGL